MAEVPTYIASVQFGDSAKRLGSASFIVSAADAQAYIAAANAAARLATDVGVLLDRAVKITRATGQNYWKKYSLQADFINDAFLYPGAEDGIYITNRWKVTFSTTNAGIPAVDSLYVPEYLITGVVMESDGISANLDDAPVSDFVSSLLATGLSKYRTAITGVLSIQRNDS